MYTINVNFKDILRIGTADSSFSVIWTGLIHDYVQVFSQVFVHSLTCHSPVRISFRSRAHGPVTFTGSQFLCNSPVTEPTSFAGPPFIHGSTNLPRSPVRFPFPLPFPVTEPTSFAGPPFVHGSKHLCRSPFPAASVLHRFSILLSFPGPHLLSLTGPWTYLVHRFPLTLLFVSSQLVHDVCICGGCMNRPR
jgi:hypothetical protein